MSWKLPWSPTGIPGALDPQATQDNFKAIEMRLNQITDEPPRVLTASSTVAEGPSGVGVDLTYTQVTVTLTPGKWLVYGQASLKCGGALDGLQLSLWNNTAGAEITDSTSAVNTPPAIGFEVALQTTAVVTVTSSVDVRLRAKRNGGSTVSVGYGGGTLTGEQRITAVRV